VIAHYRNRKSGTQNKLKDVLLQIEFNESLTYMESMQRPEKNIDFLHVESLKNYCRKEFKRIDRNIERLPEMECVKIRKKIHAILRMIETEERQEPTRLASVHTIEPGRRRRIQTTLPSL
jgi:hypothetical protein